jgi:hypothetical protein
MASRGSSSAVAADDKFIIRNMIRGRFQQPQIHVHDTGRLSS